MKTLNAAQLYVLHSIKLSEMKEQYMVFTGGIIMIF
jgi:hypothetical protein